MKCESNITPIPIAQLL